MSRIQTEWQRKLEQAYEETPISPMWDNNGIPFCTGEKCGQYDGKRCRLIGFRPGNICEPAVMSMAQMIEEEQK